MGKFGSKIKKWVGLGKCGDVFSTISWKENSMYAKNILKSVNKNKTQVRQAPQNISDDTVYFSWLLLLND